MPPRKIQIKQSKINIKVDHVQTKQNQKKRRGDGYFFILHIDESTDPIWQITYDYLLFYNI